MKILFVLRLYSGLEKSIKYNSWSPTGIPTIYKLLEKIDKKHDVKIVLIHKIPQEHQYSNYNKKQDINVIFDEFKYPVTVLRSVGKKTNKFLRVANELMHFTKILCEIYKNKPNLIYFDHSNIWSAGIISRIYKVPIVVRLLGIYPYIKKLAGVKLSINQRILKWCFKAPFSLLINTNDGSGKSKDVKNLLNYKTKYKLLLNGANVFDIHLKSHFETKKNINTKSITCLFIGKLEVYKGCITFVETIIEAVQKGLNVYAIIIGEGSQKNTLINMINQKNLHKHFDLLNNIDHRKVGKYHKLCDVYISLNHFGNMSNTVLEAIKFGQAVIMPKKLFSETDGEDIKLFGDNSVIWINDPNDKKGLIDHLEKICLDKNYLTKYKNNILKVAKRIPSWDERIDREIKLLEDTVHKYRNY